MRAIVVGASSGLGRCIATSLALGGADVALLARRLDKLEGAVAEAGPTAFAVRCDVTDEASCQSAIKESVERLGGLDSLVYATGIGPLVRLETAAADTWRQIFDTNVIGAAITTGAALPHLTESDGTAVYLSSISASAALPWPGLGAYATSKAALEKLVDAFRVEHPTVGFTRINVGDCVGGEGDSMTGFNSTWDEDLMNHFLPGWVSGNLITGTLLPVEELVRMVEQVLSNGPETSIPVMTVTPRARG